MTGKKILHTSAREAWANRDGEKPPFFGKDGKCYELRRYEQIYFHNDRRLPIPCRRHNTDKIGGDGRTIFLIVIHSVIVIHPGGPASIYLEERFITEEKMLQRMEKLMRIPFLFGRKCFMGKRLTERGHEDSFDRRQKNPVVKIKKERRGIINESPVTYWDHYHWRPSLEEFIAHIKQKEQGLKT